MNKKGLIALAGGLTAVAVAVGAVVLPKVMAQPVAVYSVGQVSYFSSGTTSTESYGVVTADKVQAVYVSDTQTVTRIYAYQGQKVSKGDLLYTYDTTLSDLTLERKDLAIQQMQVNLKTAKEELTKLKAMKPMVVTTTSGTSQNGSYTKSPSDPDELNTIYGGTGTASNPYRYWLGQDETVDETLIWGLLEMRSPVYVVFQVTKKDATNTKFSQQYGLRLEQVTVPGETIPEETEPEDPSAPEQTAPSEEPEETTAPTENTEQPTPSAPEETTQPAPAGETGEGETRGVEAAVATHREGETANQSRTSERSYVMSFFDPEEGVKESSTQVNWNSGYTQTELTTMREEKAAEISQLEFDIKMGKAELEIMKKEAANGEVYAEFDGTVVLALEPDTARALNQPMMKITGGGGYYVEGAASELELEHLQVGMTVSVNCWETGTIYTGQVTQIGRYPSEEDLSGLLSGSGVTYYPYKVFVDESADLQEGAFVSLTYETGGDNQKVLCLENAFLRKEGSSSYVYVQGQDGTLEKRYLQVGVCVDGYATPVYDGLTEGDYVAFPYGKQIREGAKTECTPISGLYG